MADKRPKLPAFTSPKGVFVWPKLNEPDYGTKEHPKPEGQYVLKLQLNSADQTTKDFIAKLQPLYDEAVATGEVEFGKLKPDQRKRLGSAKANPLFGEVYDNDEQPTGLIEFKIGMKASGTYKEGRKAGQTWHRKPAIYDAAGTVLEKPPVIWGGTKGKVSFEVRPYFIAGTGMSGLSLLLQAAQIIDLVSTGGARAASAYGFGAEDGYVGGGGSDAEPEADAAPPGDAGDADF